MPARQISKCGDPWFLIGVQIFMGGGGGGGDLLTLPDSFSENSS